MWHARRRLESPLKKTQSHERTKKRTSSPMHALVQATKQCEGTKLHTTSTTSLQELETAKGVRLHLKLNCTSKHQRYKERQDKGYV